MTAAVTKQSIYVMSPVSRAGFTTVPAPRPRRTDTRMANPNRLTAQQVVDLVKELTGREIKPVTFHSYAHRGQAPKAVEKIGNTPPVEAQRNRRMGREPPPAAAHAPTYARRAGAPHPPTPTEHHTPPRRDVS